MTRTRTHCHQPRNQCRQERPTLCPHDSSSPILIDGNYKAKDSPIRLRTSAKSALNHGIVRRFAIRCRAMVSDIATPAVPPTEVRDRFAAAYRVLEAAIAERAF